MAQVPSGQRRNWPWAAWFSWLDRLLSAGATRADDPPRTGPPTGGSTTMFTHHLHRTALQVAEERQAYATAAEQDWARLVGFTQAEWRRLVFLRWLYRQGRLADVPQDQVGPGMGVHHARV